MVRDSNRKRAVREIMAERGLTYTAALRYWETHCEHDVLMSDECVACRAEAEEAVAEAE